LHPAVLELREFSVNTVQILDPGYWMLDFLEFTRLGYPAYTVSSNQYPASPYTQQRFCEQQVVKIRHFLQRWG
jgi:hypothetical protein